MFSTQIICLLLFLLHLTAAQLSNLPRTQNYGNSAISNPGTASAVAASAGNGEVLGPKSFSLGTHEPTCEELRAMWRFSKRQSRAAEVSNEIPTYRDPFSYNIYEPYYATTRSVGGMLPRYRDATRPVYGKVIHREPLIRFADRNRALEDFSRIYGAENKGHDPRRRLVQFRFSGNPNSGIVNGVNGGGSSLSLSSSAGANSLTPHHGSFEKLKELIWTERAKELAQQRKAEEMAARAAVLREIANGQNFVGRKHQQQSPSSYTSLVNENRNPESDTGASQRNVLQPSVSSSSLSTSGIGSKSSHSGGGSSTSNNSGFNNGNNPVKGNSTGNGVLLPIMRTNGQGLYNNDGSSPPKPSHFRERNRALFRQSSFPFDSSYYAPRESRSQRHTVGNANEDIINELLAMRNYNGNDNDEFINDQEIESFIKLPEFDINNISNVNNRNNEELVDDVDNEITNGDGDEFIFVPERFNNELYNYFNSNNNYDKYQQQQQHRRKQYQLQDDFSKNYPETAKYEVLDYLFE